MLIVIKLSAKDQSGFDSPELDSPMSSSSELEEEPEESELDDESLLGADTSERTPFVSGSESGWSVQKKCGTCFLCNIVCLLYPAIGVPKAREEKIGPNEKGFPEP